VSLDFTGVMSVDALPKSIGIKFKSRFHSASAFGANLKIVGFKLARIGLRVPRDKIELLSLKTEIKTFTINGAEYTDRVINPAGDELDNRRNRSSSFNPWIFDAASCTWSALDHLIGLKVCAEYEFPRIAVGAGASFSFLCGPTRINVSLIKADPSADYYLLEYNWTRTEDTSNVRIAFDTPGSRMAREISATLSLNARYNNVSLYLKSQGNAMRAY
ncbi:hypothetical protein QAD02_007180, partial [Eretmocerus hayati]